MGANFRVLVSELSVLRQKLVICTTHAEAKLIELALKISVFKNLSLFVPKIVLECFCEDQAKVNHFF